MVEIPDRHSPEIHGRHGLFSAAAVTLAATLVTKLLSLVKDLVLASSYGASDATDAFFTALVVPNLIAGALGAALGTAVVPVAADLEARHPAERLEKLYHALFQGSMALGIALGVFVFLFASPMVRLIAPGLSSNTAELATSGLRILAAWTAIQIVVQSVYGMSYARRTFLGPALGQAFEMAMIVVMILVTAAYGRVNGLELSWLAGSLAMALPLAVVFLVQTRYRPPFRTLTDDASQVWRFVPILAFVTLLHNLFSTLDRYFGAGLHPGSVTALTLSFTLVHLPIYLIVVPLSTASLPYLSRYATQNDRAGMYRLLDSFMRIILMTLIPAIAFTFRYAPDLVRLVYERGSFGADDTMATAASVQGFSLGMIPLACLAVLAKVFYAAKRAKEIIASLVLGLAVKAGLSYVLLGPLGLFGIALATTIGVFAAWILLTFLLVRQFGRPKRGPLWDALLTPAGCSGAALALVANIEPLSTSNVLIKGFVFVPVVALGMGLAWPSSFRRVWSLIRGRS